MLYETLFFIGRCQPFHNGHLFVIEEAAKLANQVVVLIGSANSSRSPANPFTYLERKLLISEACSNVVSLSFEPLDDYPYNDADWLENAQKIMSKYNEGKVGLVGFDKDTTTYYLKSFPDIESVTIPPKGGVLNATDIRNGYFSPVPVLPNELVAPNATRKFLNNFYHTPEYKWLYDEHQFNKTYDPKKFPVIVSCVDNVVIQSGHILLVNRKNVPGKGLLALPGGHVDENERFIDAAVRELIQETAIRDQYSKIPSWALKKFITAEKFFDDPKRSQRARVTTMAYLYILPNKNPLFKVKGEDDAEHAEWYKLGDLDPTLLFEDHFHIIQTMKGLIIN